MSRTTINAIIRLRRDNDYNYDKIADTFIPANGEICLIDTETNGLQMVCGNGKDTFNKLSFIHEGFVKGFLHDGLFFTDDLHSTKIQPLSDVFYVDLYSNMVFLFDGEKYVNISAGAPTATEEISGIVKLYATTGQNIDGTMTQKSISDELNKKFSVTIDNQNESISFD